METFRAGASGFAGTDQCQSDQLHSLAWETDVYPGMVASASLEMFASLTCEEQQGCGSDFY